MEDVLDLYAQGDTDDEPTVCFDEKLVQLVSEVRQPLLARPGRVARYDYEYRRAGTANLFMHFRPSGGWRHVAVTAQRTTRDFAEQMRQLVDEHFPAARRIRVVLDNLNTHGPAALYASFPPAEARRVVRKLEFHYTPKHGSWLNMVEIELAVLTGQCLRRRIGDRETLAQEVGAWEAARNTVQATVAWQFGLDEARLKLDRLYTSKS